MKRTTLGTLGTLCALLAATMLAGCGGASSKSAAASAPPPLDADGKPRVFVSIAPMATFAEKIGGDFVHVELLVEPGRSPATYQPSPQQMVRLGEAQALFRIGVPFEKAFIAKLRAAYPGLRIVDTRQGVELLDITEGGACCAAHAEGEADTVEADAHDHAGHDHAKHDHDNHAGHDHGDHAGHDHGHAHDHGAHDPHIWTSTENAKIVARTMARVLSETAPQHKDAYAKNLAAYEAELDATDRKLAELLAPVKGRSMYVYHPAFGYFAKRYGLTQTSVERDGKSPSARHVDELVTAMKGEGVRALFVQPQFSKTAMQGLAQAVGAEVVVLDPLARDYCANLLSMGEAIAQGLGASPAPQSVAVPKAAE